MTGTVCGYIAAMRGLSEMGRFQGRFMLARRNVAEHVCAVAKIAQYFARLEQAAGQVVDVAEVLQRALCHDDMELWTGDLLPKLKKRNAANEEMVRQTEIALFEEEYTALLPKDWHADFYRYAIDSKAGGVEGQIIAAADLVDRLFESLHEIMIGNKAQFVDTFRQDWRKLAQISLGCVSQFRDEMLQLLEVYIERDIGGVAGLYRAITEAL